VNAWLKKSFAVYSANGLNFLLNILLIPILVYTIGFSGYAVYSIYIVFSATFLLLDMALSKSVVGAIYSSEADAHGRMLGSARQAYFLAGVLLLLGAPLIGEGARILFPLRIGELNIAYWIGIVAVLEYVISLPGQYFQMLNVLRGRQLLYAKYLSCVQLSRFVAVSLVAVITRNVEWVLTAVLLRKSLDFVVLWLFWRKQEAENTERAALAMVGKLFRQAAPMVGVAFLYQVLGTEFVSIYISHVYGAAILGKYRSIYDILTKIWFVAALYPVLVYPRLCKWLADPVYKAWLQDRLTLLTLISSLLYGMLVLAGIAVLGWSALCVNTLADIMPFAAGLLAGVCMSGHVRLSIELLQAQRAAGAALLVNLLSIGAGASALYMFSDAETMEIGLAWLASQLIMVIFVDLLNCIVLRSSLKKSIMGILPWIVVGAVAVYAMWRRDTLANYISLIALAGFLVGFVVLIKRAGIIESLKCTR
jgi:hypothetical protein